MSTKNIYKNIEKKYQMNFFQNLDTFFNVYFLKHACFCDSEVSSRFHIFFTIWLCWYRRHKKMETPLLKLCLLIYYCQTINYNYQIKSQRIDLVSSIINMSKVNKQRVNDKNQQLQKKSQYSSSLKKFVDKATINILGQIAFKADIGEYIQLNSFPQYFVKHVNAQFVIKQLKESKEQSIVFFSRMMKSQFNSVTKLCKQIDNYLMAFQNQGKQEQRYLHQVNLQMKTKDQQQRNKRLKNIKQNYLVKYYQRIDSQIFDEFIIQEPIIITLQQLMKKKKKLKYEQSIQIFWEIVKILQFLQQLRISHRNITPSNIVFVYKDNVKHAKKIKFQDWQFDKAQHMIKICGFYQSVYVHPDPKVIDREYSKVIFKNVYTDPNITMFDKPKLESDIWAAGMIFFQMLNGYVPNLALERDKVYGSFDKLMKWHQDFFTFLFKGTNNSNFTFKDFKLRVKNLSLTSKVTGQLIRQKQKKQVMNMGISNKFKEYHENSFLPRKRLLSVQINQL